MTAALQPPEQLLPAGPTGTRFLARPEPTALPLSLGEDLAATPHDPRSDRPAPEPAPGSASDRDPGPDADPEPHPDRGSAGPSDLDGPTGPAARPGRPTRLSPHELWTASRVQSDLGHWPAALRLTRRALRALTAEADGGTPSPEQQEARVRLEARIMVSEAFCRSELGETTAAAELLDAAERRSPSATTAAAICRGMLLLRTGHRDAALAEFDRAEAASREPTRSVLGRAGSTGSVRRGLPAADVEDQVDLAGMFINRGFVHMMAGRLTRARADCDAAERIARRLGRPDIEFMALHNGGYVRYLAGDLPGALAMMERARQTRPEAVAGVGVLDRAKVLRAAGLLAESRDAVAEATASLERHRSTADLVDAYGLRAELDLLTGDPESARSFARSARRLARTRGNDAAALAADLLIARADSRNAAAGRASARAVARRTARLADGLTAAGLAEEARSARLLQAGALLDAGDDAAAAAARTAAGRLTPDSPLPVRLHTRLIDSRLALAAGRRTEGLRHVRRGLDDLTRFRAQFGSQDMQASTAAHSADLTRLGLRTAVESGSPAAILEWLERSRAVTTRLPVVRPPSDPVLAAHLGSLRALAEQHRESLLRGQPSPAVRKQVEELRRAVRARSWQIGASGRPQRPLSLTEAQRRLADDPTRPTLLAYFHGSGEHHVLVLDGSRARHLRLAHRDRHGTLELLRRIVVDQDLLCDARVPTALRTVAARSLANTLRTVGQRFVEPLLPLLRSGPVVVADAGPTTVLPWLALPGLAGREVSVSSSVTAALDLTAPAAVAAARRGVLAVAGPGVPHGADEVQQVAAQYAALDAEARTITGAAATGDAVLRAIVPDGLLHVAAHGVHEPDSPLFSGVQLADGMLSGYDIAPNPALPAVAVLSSCDVGQVDVRPGWEPLGLVASLLRSGVRTVVAGTSKIDDQAARDVMVHLHAEFAHGLGPAAALSRALEACGAFGSLAAGYSPDALPVPLTCFGTGAGATAPGAPGPAEPAGAGRFAAGAAGHAVPSKPHR